MQKEGQIKTALIILFSVIVLVAILASFSLFGKVTDKVSDVEVLNLKQSIQTRVLQLSTGTGINEENVSFAVPSSINRVCFFDSKKNYSYLANPELTELYSEDEKNKLFFRIGETYFPFQLSNIELKENPLCVKIRDNKIELKITGRNNKAMIEASSEDNDAGCVSVLENGNPNDKIDIVFLGYGFEEMSAYNSEVNRYMNEILLQFEPFSENREKFNFFRVDDADIDCEVKNFIQCDNYQIKMAASNCPNDYIFVLVDRSAVADFITPVRSSAIGSIVKLNTADKPFVMVHEFGHSFGDLADEYVDERYYSSIEFDPGDYVNCDNTPCSTWEKITGTGCFSGCSLGDYYRPTQTSIMRSLSSDDFGPVNEEELKRRLGFYE